MTNATTTIDLDVGQTYLLGTIFGGDDLTGRRVQSNFPVAVFGSSPLVLIPSTNCESPDHIVEQMFPYLFLGEEFFNRPIGRP